MGCGGSKVDDQPLVILCRERKELIKAASYHRSALAAAHLAYFQSLCDVGESIKRFVDEELVLAGSNNNSSPPDSPVLTLPSDQGKKKHKISSSSTSVSHSLVQEDEEEDGEGSHLHLSSGSEFDSGSESGSDDSLGHHHIHIESSPKVKKEQPLPETYPPGYPPSYPPSYPPGYQPGYSSGYQYPGQGWGFMGENPNPYQGVYFMKKSAPPSRPVVFQPENHRVENGQWPQENGYGYSNAGYYGYPEQQRRAAPPSPARPPPSPPTVSTWDFLNVFDTYDYNRAGAGESSGFYPAASGVKSNSSSLDSREVREREGIPELEDETEQETLKQSKRNSVEKMKEHIPENEPSKWSQLDERKIKKRGGDSGEGTSRDVPMVESSFSSKTVSSFTSSEEGSEFHHVNEGEERSSSHVHEAVARKSVGEVEEEYVRKKGVSFELEENIAATSFDVESSKISSLSALSVHATRDLREVVKEIKSEFEVASSHGKEVAVLLEVSKLPYQQKSSGLKVIFSRIMSSRSQPQPSIRLTSRILKIAKSYNVQDVPEGFTANLSSTLEKLYAWEKKLYKEVKDEEKLRVIYEEKCKTLKKLDSLGAESSKIDTTRAAIRKLLTKLDVCIRSVDSISSRIHKLRDEELQPQLTQLIHGCGHCKQLAPEYEKAASELSSHVPPVVLAKIDASEETNKEFATKYSVQGFPTIKILRNGGKAVQEYNGPREADGIVTYLKKQSGPASLEIKSADAASEVVGDKNVVAVGVFPKLSGAEFDSFMATAEKLRSDYDFAHTTDAKLLPRGESVTGPVVRLFKPFDELFVDFRDFVGEALEKFVKESSIPLITVFDSDPNNHPYVLKFFEIPNTKALFFLNFNGEGAETLKSKYREVAASNKGHGLSFLLGDAKNSEEALQHYGVEQRQLPLIILQTVDDKKYLKTNVEVDQIESWINDFKDGKASPYKKSQPIPGENNEPVKVVVAENLDEMVFSSGKNVLLEFYAPWCGHCQNLVPILDEVAVSYQSDPSVVIAKFDATANDFPHDTFDVKGFPTIYLRSANGNIVLYKGDRTKEDIISFIDKNKDTAGETKTEEKKTKEVKDEL